MQPNFSHEVDDTQASATERVFKHQFPHETSIEIKGHIE